MTNEIFKVNTGANPDNYEIKIIPDFNDKSNKNFRLINTDASKIDFINIGEKIKFIEFNNKTKFPDTDKLPKNFNPTEVLENGKNPGLGIKNLHKQGITGKGITIAIIDQLLDTQHQEYKDNLIHYENFGYPETYKASMHGTAVSSILCGKTTGVVAPDVKLVYFAANQLKGQDGETGIIQNEEHSVYFSNYAKALRKILEINKTLSAKDKISAVSISWGMLSENQECKKLIQQLKDSGVFVITTDLYKTYGLDFITIDRKMNSDPDDPNSYDAGFWFNENNTFERPNILLAPAGGRTTAGPQGHNNYVYYGTGGMSWSTPYIAGVYALAKQVNKNITPESFWNIALKTGEPLIKNGITQGTIIQPEKIIKTLQQELNLKIVLEKRNSFLK